MPVRNPNRALVRGVAALACITACKHPPQQSALFMAHSEAVDASYGRPPATTLPIQVQPQFTPPTQIVAQETWVPIRNDPRRDAQLAGYLRAGAITAVEGTPVNRDNCAVRRDHPEGGWYHLPAGGYVCVGGWLAVPWPSRNARRPTQPDLESAMPYQYAVVYGQANLYRALPTRAQLRRYERMLRRPIQPAVATDNNSPMVGAHAPTDATDMSWLASVSAALEPSAPLAETQQPTQTTAADSEPRLSDLRGDPHSLMIRRMLTGMYVSLDREMVNHRTHQRFWRTQGGGYARTGALSLVRNVPRFSGTVLDATHALPFAFMFRDGGRYGRLSPNARRVAPGPPIPRLTPIQLVAEPPVQIGRQQYYRTNDGLVVNAKNLRIARLRPPPRGTGPTEKWIDVDLDEQILVAYEGSRPVFVTLVSTGRRSRTNPDRNYETPAGVFRIRSKHITTTMDGDTAADGPYSIEDVPWVMYFQESYGFHAAFWHGRYGWEKSHGCVNLSPADARWLFRWSEPQLPTGWHAIYASAQHPGTRVVLHRKKPTERRTQHRRTAHR